MTTLMLIASFLMIILTDVQLWIKVVCFSSSLIVYIFIGLCKLTVQGQQNQKIKELEERIEILEENLYLKNFSSLFNSNIINEKEN